MLVPVLFGCVNRGQAIPVALGPSKATHTFVGRLALCSCSMWQFREVLVKKSATCKFRNLSAGVRQMIFRFHTCLSALAFDH